MTDPLYSPEIIPTLYAKIGVLTVRCEMLTAQLAAQTEIPEEAADEAV